MTRRERRDSDRVTNTKFSCAVGPADDQQTGHNDQDNVEMTELFNH